MTAPHIIDPARMLGQALADASPDLMRHLLATVINALLSADADAVCGAEYGVASPDRVNQRNGYRHRELDTRVGTIDVAIPKLRQGSYFPEWLLERRKRAEAALITVVATCYLLGVSTRRMDKLVKTLGINSLSKSQVSRMAADLDEQVAAFRTRPLGDAGPFTFVAADALTMKVRENGRVVNAVVLVATGVNGDGHREVLGVRVATSETKEAWNVFFADLVARGLLVSGWSPATRTPAWSRRSRRTCPAPPGNGVVRTTPRTSCASAPSPPGRRSRRCCTASTTSPTPRPCMPSSTSCSTR